MQRSIFLFTVKFRTWIWSEHGCGWGDSEGQRGRPGQTAARMQKRERPTWKDSGTERDWKGLKIVSNWCQALRFQMFQEMAKHSLWRKKHDQRKSDHNDLLSALKTLWLSAGRTVVKTLKTAVATWSSTLTAGKGAHRCTHPNVPHQIVSLNGPWSVSCVWTLPVIRLGAQRCWKGTRRKPQRTVADRSRHQTSWWDLKAWRTENDKAANESHIVSPCLTLSPPFPVVRSCLLASSSFSWQFDAIWLTSSGWCWGNSMP